MTGFIIATILYAALGIVAVNRGYISVGKGARADQVDDDLKAARDNLEGK